MAKLFHKLVEGAEIAEARDDFLAKVLAVFVCGFFLFAENEVKLSSGYYVFTADFDV